MRNTYKNSLATGFLLLILALLPISCDLVCNDSCGCGSQTQVNDFKIISFEMLTININGEELNSEVSQPYNQVFKSFKIKDIETVATVESSIGIPGVAFACSPPPLRSQETLSELNIFNTKEVTLGDGTVIKVGDNLNDLFEINYYFVSDTKPIEEFFSENKIIYLDDYFKLAFTKAPQKQVVIEFSIQFIFENGREISINDQKLSIQ